MRLEPRNAFAQHDLGVELVACGDLSNAVTHLAEAVRLLPNGYDRQYNALSLNYALGEAYFRLEHYAQSIPALETALRFSPTNSHANYLIAMAKAWLGETDTTSPYFDAAVRSEPRLAQLPDYYDLLSGNYAKQGLYTEGLKMSEKAGQLAEAAGRGDQAAKLRQRAQYCRSRQ